MKFFLGLWLPNTKYEDIEWVEVTKAQFIRAEHKAGLRKDIDPGQLATLGFVDGDLVGRVEEK